MAARRPLPTILTLTDEFGEEFGRDSAGLGGGLAGLSIGSEHVADDHPNKRVDCIGNVAF